MFHLSEDRKRRHPLTVRVIDYTIEDGRRPDGPFRLITTIVDPDDISAVDLAAAYAQRWEIDSAFDELKTHQRGPRSVLRSKSPDLVLQEIWGPLCCHYAIRTPMWEAADHIGADPDRVSFVAALRIARRSISAARDFPPQATEHTRRYAITLLARRLNPARRHRSNPRVVKRKYVKWHVKREHHKTWPQPTGPPRASILSPRATN
ncbi:MAG: hypothetical protein ACP5P1_11060 [Acidimicrobiales bacterium]